MREVSVEAFAAARADGAVTIDVREPHEYVAGHIPGATFIPLEQLPYRLQGIPRNQPVFIVCASGNRSFAVAEDLARAGFDAHSVAGGTAAWQSSGRPVIRGTHASAAA